MKELNEVIHDVQLTVKEETWFKEYKVTKCSEKKPLNFTWRSTISIDKISWVIS